MNLSKTFPRYKLQYSLAVLSYTARCVSRMCLELFLDKSIFEGDR